MSFISFLILLDWLGSVQCRLEVVGVDILTLFPISGQLSLSPSDIMLAIGFFFFFSIADNPYFGENIFFYVLFTMRCFFFFSLPNQY